MEDFNWVSAQAKCFPEAVFEQMKSSVGRDIDEINKFWTAQRQPAYRFELSSYSDRFLVTLLAAPARSIEFKLVNRTIEIQVKSGEKLIATPVMNRDGECKLAVGSVEMEVWQVCRMALEKLFFAGY